MTLRYSHSVVFSRHIGLIKKLFAEGWLVQGVHGHLKEKDEEFTMSLNTFRKFLLEYKISKREIKKNGPGVVIADSVSSSAFVPQNAECSDDLVDSKVPQVGEIKASQSTIPLVTKSVEVPRMLDAVDKSLSVPATHAEFLRLRNEQNGEGK